MTTDTMVSLTALTRDRIAKGQPLDKTVMEAVAIAAHRDRDVAIEFVTGQYAKAAPCCTPTAYLDSFGHEFGSETVLVVDDACSPECDEAARREWRAR